MNFSENENTVLRKEKKKKKPRFLPELEAGQWKEVPWTQFLTSVV